MRVRGGWALLLASGALAAGALAVGGGAVAASASAPESSPMVDPSPSATSGTAVSLTVDGTASPTPSPSSSSGGGSSGGGTGGGSTGGGSTGGGSTGGGTTAPACTPSEKGPTLPSSPASGGGHLKVSAHQLAQGADLTIIGDGFRAGEKVVVALYSSPVKLGVFTARTNGQLYAQVTIPHRTQLGVHTVQATGYQSCAVASATLSVVSPRGSGSSVFPWIVWIVAGGGVACSAIGLLIAFLLGWAPKLAAAVAVGSSGA